MMTNEAIVATSDFRCPALLRSSMMMGMLPTISMTAKSTMPAVTISLMSKFMVVSLNEYLAEQMREHLAHLAHLDHTDGLAGGIYRIAV
jgi:Mg-chelatase subunit ChlD